jgi:hypothetical protein
MHDVGKAMITTHNGAKHMLMYTVTKALIMTHNAENMYADVKYNCV